MFHSHNGKAVKTLSNSVISECISLFYRNDVGNVSKYCWETELHWNREGSVMKLFLYYNCICLSLRWKTNTARHGENGPMQRVTERVSARTPARGDRFDMC